MTIAFEYDGGEGHDIEIQWYHNGVALVDGGGVSGATTTTLTIPDEIEYDGEYYATVTDTNVPGCELTTDTVEVEIPDVCRLEITVQPQSQEVTEGGDLELTVAYTGEQGSVTFQWYLDGNPLTDGASGGSTISGATTDTLAITNIEAALAGDYTVVITDDGVLECEVESEAATVTVEVPPAENTISMAFFIQMLTQPDPAGADIISNYDFETWDDPSGSVQGRIRISMAAVGGGSDEYTFTVTVTEGALTSTMTSTPISLPLRTWHHVAVVYSGDAGTAQLYVDATFIGGTSGDTVTLSTQPFGYANFTGAAHSTLDYLDSYAYLQDLTGVWVGHALTTGELTELYNGGAGFNGPPWGSIAEPTAWWSFDDAGRIDATENFVDSISSIELDPSGSIVQLEGLIDFAVVKTGFARTLETDVIAAFAYTA